MHIIQHHPQEIMFRLETFLNLQHANYTHDVLQAVSHNANSNIMKGGATSTTKTTNNESTTSDLVIHKPYSFTHEKEFQQLSRNVLHPSLCLFEKAFGWKIHITTESEFELHSNNNMG